MNTRTPAKDWTTILAEAPAELLPELLRQSTPAEVDTLLAPRASNLARLEAEQWQALTDGRKYRRGSSRFDVQRAERAELRAAELVEPINEAAAVCRPYQDEYRRRGGWPRIYWCTANGGHAHASSSCRTLHITTGLVWLPDLSGTDEAALVEMAGESACSACYPTAPRSVLARPSTLRPAVEEREAREARAREAADRATAKASKEITAPDGGRLVVDGETIATEHTARARYIERAAEAADHAVGVTAYGLRPDLAARYGAHAAHLLAALAHKHGRTVDEEAAELAPKVDARRKRDARERAKYAAH